MASLKIIRDTEIELEQINDTNVEVSAGFEMVLDIYAEDGAVTIYTHDGPDGTPPIYYPMAQDLKAQITRLQRELDEVKTQRDHARAAAAELGAEASRGLTFNNAELATLVALVGMSGTHSDSNGLYEKLGAAAAAQGAGVSDIDNRAWVVNHKHKIAEIAAHFSYIGGK